MARPSRARHRKPTARELAEQATFDALVETLEGIGYTVTVSPTLEGRGGHCVVRGERRVLLPRRLPAAERVDLLTDVLRGEDLNGVFLRPDIRDLVQPPPLADRPPRKRTRPPAVAAASDEREVSGSGRQAPAARPARARKAKGANTRTRVT